MNEARLQELLLPFILSDQRNSSLPEGIYGHLVAYLDLLLRWNSRTNLTAIRKPEEIVRRHFGESIFTAQVLRMYVPTGATLLDVGSGAGFPGLPIQLVLPSLSVTLAESQGKKAAFLREAARVLGLQTEIWAGRVETMASDRLFDMVTLRAVDRMGAALDSAATRLAAGGLLAELSSAQSPVSARLEPFQTPIVLPESTQRFLKLWIAAH